MDRYLLKQGYLIKKDAHSEKVIKQTLKDLTITPKVLKSYETFAKPKPFTIYKESENYYYIPRFYGIEKFGKPKVTKIPEGNSINLSIVKPYDVLPHQKKAYSTTIAKLKEHNGTLLSLYAGGGKTFLAIKISCDFIKGKTLVIVNKECLMDQWKEAIIKFTGGKARIGIIQQNKCEIEEKDFTICMLHTISKRDFPDGTFDSFKFCIIDECHHLGSSMFSQTLPKVNCKYMLALSATPTRGDGCMHVVHAFIGQLGHMEKRDGTNKIIVKRFKLNSKSPEYETLLMSNGTKNTSAMVTNIARSTSRNLLIVESVKELMKEDRKILILSGRREHLETLHFLLNDAKIKTIHNKYITVGYYYGNNGGSTKSNHKAMLELSSKCDVILGTHAIASEGLDIPDLNTEIIATPLADVEQAVGRILRKFHTINPIVIDLIDNCGNFVNQARKRLKLYHREGYNEYDKVINLDNFNDEINNIISHINSPDHIINNKEDLGSSISSEDNEELSDNEDVLNQDKEISDDFSIDLFSKKKIKPTAGVCLI